MKQAEERTLYIFMKKVLTLILTLTMIFTFTACEGGEEHTYVVPKERCVTLFGCTPDVAVEDVPFSPWIDGNYVSIEEGNDGNLVIVLNDKHVKHWRETILGKFEKSNEANGEHGLGFELSQDYSVMKYYTNKDVYRVVGIRIGLLFPYCGILQMLDGVDPNEWYVDIKVIDVDTGIIVKEGRLPDDKKFGVKTADWEKAMEKVE